MSPESIKLTEMTYQIPVLPAGIPVPLAMIATYPPKSLNTATNDAIEFGLVSEIEARAGGSILDILEYSSEESSQTDNDQRIVDYEAQSHHLGQLRSIAYEWLDIPEGPPAELLNEIYELSDVLDELVAAPGLSQNSVIGTPQQKEYFTQRANKYKAQTYLAEAIKEVQHDLGRPARITGILAGMAIAGGLFGGFLYTTVSESDARAAQKVEQFSDEEKALYDQIVEDDHTIDNGILVGALTVLASGSGGLTGYFASRRAANRLAQARAKSILKRSNNIEVK